MPRAQPSRERYLRLDLGESSAPASDAVIQAIRDLPPDHLARYPDPVPLTEALALHHGVGRGRVLVTAGTDEAIRQVFNTYVEEGARVVLPRPTFGAFLAAAEAGGAFVARVDHRDDLSLDPEDYAAALTPRTPRLAVLSLPDAPTGTAMDVDRVVELARGAPETLFLINESFVAFHGPSVLDPQHGPTPANLLVMRSFSKDYGLAGLRVGYLVGHPQVIADIDLVRPAYTVSASALAGALAALADQGAMRANVLRVRGAMDRLITKLSLRGIEGVATRANFVLVKLSSPIQPWAAGFAARGILVGTAGHVGPLAGFVRVTVNSDDEIDALLDALDLLLLHGLRGAARVEGVPGSWDDVGSEGMA